MNSNDPDVSSKGHPLALDEGTRSIILNLLKNAGFEDCSIRPEGKDEPSMTYQIRLPGLTTAHADIGRMKAMLPMIDACGVTVLGHGAGSFHHDKTYNGVFILILAAEIPDRMPKRLVGLPANTSF